MSIYVDPKGNKIKVTHVLADGTRLDDITGHHVPDNEENSGIYYVLRSIAARIMREAGMESQKGA